MKRALFPLPATKFVRLRALLGLALVGQLGGVSFSADEPPVLCIKQGSSAPLRQGAQAGYAAIVETIAPSVVSILSWTTRATNQPQVAPHHSQRPLFPPGSTPAPGGNPELTPSLMAVGSGVILTEDGHILTNSHVVAEAQWILVVVAGSNEKFDALVLGRDTTTDLAVLKIEKSGLQAAKFGNSELMKAGDVVLAIGNAFGLSQSVSSGIVSATTRDDIDIAGLENFIQTDAPINPGNSGGALINTNGEVIGINTAIFSQNGGSVGVGFAINGNLALKIAKRLAAKGEITRGYLGVTVAEVTPELAKIFMTQPSGALVNDVVEYSPAGLAGLKPGDIIVSINGTPIANHIRFRLAMADLEPESMMEMEVIRMGTPHKLEAILCRMPNEAATRLNRVEDDAHRASKPQAFLSGITIAELTPALRRENAVPAQINGVLVSHVEPAAVLRSRLRPGLVICEVGGRPITSVQQAVEASSNSSNRRNGALLLRVWNAGQGYAFTSVDSQ